MLNKDQINILLIEDNPADIYLMRNGLNNSEIFHQLHLVVDGDDAIKFLNKESKYLYAPTPDFILLDLNLPRKDGREVLEELKNDSRLNKIPLIILSTSEFDKNILDEYDSKTNKFIIKPFDMKSSKYIIHEIEKFIKNNI